MRNKLIYTGKVKFARVGHMVLVKYEARNRENEAYGIVEELPRNRRRIREIIFTTLKIHIDRTTHYTVNRAR